MSRLAGKVAIVTGGAGGIGAATAHELAREGAAVAVVDIDEAKATEVVDKIRRTGARAIALGGDLVVFLASEQSRYITGQMISIEGGMSAHVALDTGD
jgi:NAD(P)-dependent dehydrogenase (short-subunit alcohol dehydrogenase family)